MLNLSAILLSSAVMLTQGTDPFQQRAAAVCDLTSQNPVGVESSFNPAYLQVVPANLIAKALGGVAQELGRCVSASIVGPAASPNARFIKLSMDTGAALNAVMALDGSGLITDLTLTYADDPRVKIATWNDVELALRRLGGQTSAFMRSSQQQHAFHADKPLAIGSAFKMYVLGALHEEMLQDPAGWRWSRTVPLRDEWRSFPDGEMMGWPTGSLVSLFEYARKMIAESDNTATEHLFQLLGREKIAAAAARMGLDAHRGNQPFLAVNELFKLKRSQDTGRANRYVAASPQERIDILSELSQVPYSDVCIMPACYEESRYIESIEWFATTEDTCKAASWLDERDDPFIHEAMRFSNRRRFLDLDNDWRRVGFKGGSEPGVLHLAFAVVDANGNRACLSLGWNDPNFGSFSGAVRQAQLLDIAGKTLRLLKRQM